ncbi:MAG: HD domain-containing protein [Lachnospiraceae bacterium]|nr:HD domain-containing protein [Lachnospiraceae bacterium]
MVIIFYSILFLISLVCATIYIYMWHRHFDVNMNMIITLIPISCLGYVLAYTSTDIERAVISVQISYIGGCFLQFFITNCILNLCKIEVRKWIKVMMFTVSTLSYLSVLSIGYADIFYKDYSFEVVDGVGILTRHYGFMHTVFYIIIYLYAIIGVAAIVYSWFKKKQVPRTIIYMLIIPELLSMGGYLIGKKLTMNLEITPLCYVLSEIVFISIAYRINLYNVGDTVIDSMLQDRDIGYISFNLKNNYLGSNEVARELVPELNDVAVDSMIGYKPTERKLRHYIESFKNDPKDNTFVFTAKSKTGNPDDDKIYNVNVNNLYLGNRQRGYILTFTDDTANRKYIRLIDDYNEKLQEEVEEKTKHIVDMHDNLIMSLAMMVESRDNSTGGHIMRTSEGVRILIDEIKKQGSLSLSPEFCENVIKAAPMHDLGKIAVDDAVLRKPGRFTDEEYEKMKKHAEEGARVIHKILENTDDTSFKAIAENVAHYHHERFDGSGYPEKLKGDNIPLEARIMAIADVYDALVSKRVYKEAFDFEKANTIIMEGMGTQFDPKLQAAYEKARPKLEKYYKGLNN